MTVKLDRLRHRPRGRADPDHPGRLGRRHRRLPGAGAGRAARRRRRRPTSTRSASSSTSSSPAACPTRAPPWPSWRCAAEREAAAADAPTTTTSRSTLEGGPARARERARGPLRDALAYGAAPARGARGRSRRRRRRRPGSSISAAPRRPGWHRASRGRRPPPPAAARAAAATSPPRRPAPRRPRSRRASARGFVRFVRALFALVLVAIIAGLIAAVILLATDAGQNTDLGKYLKRQRQSARSTASSSSSGTTPVSSRSPERVPPLGRRGLPRRGAGQDRVAVVARSGRRRSPPRAPATSSVRR